MVPAGRKALFEDLEEQLAKSKDEDKAKHSMKEAKDMKQYKLQIWNPWPILVYPLRSTQLISGKQMMGLETCRERQWLKTVLIVMLTRSTLPLKLGSSSQKGISTVQNGVFSFTSYWVFP